MLKLLLAFSVCLLAFTSSTPQGLTGDWTLQSSSVDECLVQTANMTLEVNGKHQEYLFDFEITNCPIHNAYESESNSEDEEVQQASTGKWLNSSCYYFDNFYFTTDYSKCFVKAYYFNTTDTLIMEIYDTEWNWINTNTLTLTNAYPIPQYPKEILATYTLSQFISPSAYNSDYCVPNQLIATYDDSDMNQEDGEFYFQVQLSLTQWYMQQNLANGYNCLNQWYGGETFASPLQDGTVKLWHTNENNQETFGMFYPANQSLIVNVDQEDGTQITIMLTQNGPFVPNDQEFAVDAEEEEEGPGFDYEEGEEEMMMRFIRRA